MKVVPKSASRTVTRSDSAYLAKVLRLGNVFARGGMGVEMFADSAVEVSASMNSFRTFRCSLREFPAPFLRHPALLLFYCGLPTPIAFCLHPKLPLRMFSGVPAPIRCECDIRRAAIRAAGAIPATRICGRLAPDRPR